MAHITPVDYDALNVMKRAGEDFAEQQIWRHHHNEWDLSDEAKRERIAHWRTVKYRIGDIVEELKREMKEAK